MKNVALHTGMLIESEIEAGRSSMIAADKALPEKSRTARSLKRRFQRVTSTASYVPEVDGIRLVAILAVFIFHLAGDVLRHSAPGYSQSLHEDPVFWTTQVLNIGVQLFFVLSGYVLALPFLKQYQQMGQVVSLRRYFLRRLTRLEPPYIVSLGLLFLLKILGGRGSVSMLAPHLAASLGYVHNLVYGRPSDINFVAWSLEIEVQFYLLAPLLCFLFFRNPTRWKRQLLLAACCVGCGVAAAHFGDSPRLGLSLVGQLPYFLAGLLLADAVRVTPVGKRATSGGIWDAACVGLICLLFYWIHLGWAMVYAGALTVAACYWTAFRSRWILTFLRAGIVSTVGGMCYSIYLLHNYVIGFAGQFTEGFASGQPFVLRLVIEACLLGPLVLLVSGSFYLLVERPCMRPDWPQRLASKFRPILEKSGLGRVSQQPAPPVEGAGSVSGVS